MPASDATLLAANHLLCAAITSYSVWLERAGSDPVYAVDALGVLKTATLVRHRIRLGAAPRDTRLF